MPLSIKELKKKIKKKYPNLRIQEDDQYNEDVSGFFVDVEGIKGGKGYGSKREVNYNCYVDLSKYPQDDPDIWVTNLKNSKIKHMNISPSEYCPRLGRSFPKVNSGTIKEKKKFKEKQDIDEILDSLKEVLNTQDPEGSVR